MTSLTDKKERTGQTIITASERHKSRMFGKMQCGRPSVWPWGRLAKEEKYKIRKITWNQLRTIYRVFIMWQVMY